MPWRSLEVGATFIGRSRRPSPCAELRYYMQEAWYRMLLGLEGIECKQRMSRRCSLLVLFLTA
jgi:hypothetical protein